MIFLGFTMDEYIINEYHHKYSEEWSQQSIHNCLECGKTSSNTIGHNIVFKMPIVSLKSSLASSPATILI
jgi:hypothetical protein